MTKSWSLFPSLAWSRSALLSITWLFCFVNMCSKVLDFSWHCHLGPNLSYTVLVTLSKNGRPYFTQWQNISYKSIIISNQKLLTEDLQFPFSPSDLDTADNHNKHKQHNHTWGRPKDQVGHTAFMGELSHKYILHLNIYIPAPVPTKIQILIPNTVSGMTKKWGEKTGRGKVRINEL